MGECPACRSTDCRHLLKRATLEIQKCLSCGLEFALQAAEHAAPAIETSHAYHDWTMQDFGLQLEVARRVLPVRLRAYESILGRRPASVLEIACGSGAYARAFQDLGLEYMAVEIDSRMAQFARSNTGARVLAGDFATLSVPGRWDVVFFSQVLEHVVDPASFLDKARQLATGLVHLDVPNQDGMAASYRKLRHPSCYGSIEAPHHLIGYNRSALEHLLTRVGLKVQLLRSFRNDHPTWGQLYDVQSWQWRLYYVCSDLLDRASLLTAVCLT